MPPKTIDLLGRRFTRLLVVSQAPSRLGARWNCRCDCGNTVVVYGHNLLKSAHPKKGSRSCGCLKREGLRLNPRPSRRAIYLPGQRFGHLQVLTQSGKDDRGELLWLCECDCGKRVAVRSSSLRYGNSRSCGCRIGVARETPAPHPLSKTPEYRCWQNMHNRCGNKDLAAYGGRGIKVCGRWGLFENFHADMGLRPSPKLSIERVNNDGDYEPDNCVWGTRRVQNNNQRSNRLVAYRGETMSLANAVRRAGAANYFCVKARLKQGWPVEVALETPARAGRQRITSVEYRGQRMSLAAAVRAFGAVSYHVASQRLLRGWSVEDAIDTPRRKLEDKRRRRHRQPPCGGAPK